jgi:nitrogen fixation-related uncharacterized protein
MELMTVLYIIAGLEVVISIPVVLWGMKKGKEEKNEQE